jgi:CRISPR-associated protein Csd1
MSWIEKLHQTYENNTDKIGDRKDSTPLLPIFHTTKKRAHVEIVLDEQGVFKRASVISEDGAKTILPATESSAGRTSGEAPHPLADQLQYTASEYKRYGGTKKHYHEGYKNLLKGWAESKHANQKVKAVYQYISRGTLISDLVAEKVLHVDESGKLFSSWKGKSDNKLDIFKALGQGQGQTDVFVRWSVETPGVQSSELQYDKTIWQSWIDYYLSTRSKNTFCYVSGESNSENPKYGPEQYPRMIRSDNDGAKLISSNDTSGFTYRGRFTDEDQVCGVDVVVAQRAHNALRWLITRQGKVLYVKNEPKLAVVAWAVSGLDVPDPLADSDDLLGDATVETEAKEIERSRAGFTAQDFGVRLSQYLSGYSVKLGKTEEIIVMGVDSATPGRMAVTYYRELTGSDFLQRIKSWHHGCAWQQRFLKDFLNKEGKKQKRVVEFFGAPAPNDIAMAAYGTKDDDKIRIDDNIRKTTIERLIPSIIDGVPLPWDIVASCIKKATQKQSLPDWVWQKTLGIACGLYRYYFKEKEDYTMGLDRERKTRDYLYGRLLAVADCLEGYALWLSNEDRQANRQTNATKLMQRFAERPCSTWKTIELALVPYKARLNRNNKYNVELDAIHGLFNDVPGYTSDVPLSGEFLLGFHCQRIELFKSSSENINTQEENGNESNQ